MLTQDELKDLIHYDPDTGIFQWKVLLSNNAKLGVPIGSDSGTGHLTISIHKQRYLLHRLAFLYMEGALPTMDVDHRNGNPADNSWKNLRLCNKQQNRQNTVNSRKKNGLIGMRPSTQACGKQFRSYITFNGVSKHIGYFETPMEAHHAYLIAKSILHPFWDKSNVDPRSSHLDLTYPGHLSKKFQKYVESLGVLDGSAN